MRASHAGTEGREGLDSTSAHSLALRCMPISCVSDSDDDAGAASGPADVGMDAVLRRASTKSALSLNPRAAGSGGVGGGVSSDEEDSGLDSDSEQQGAGAEESRNARERARDTEHGPRRDHEVVHTARLQQQGIALDEDQEKERAGRDWTGTRQTDEQKAARKQKAMASASAAAGGDTEMADGDADDAGFLDDRARQAQIRARFDKSQDDKYMTFDAEDPLKPNPSQ